MKKYKNEMILAGVVLFLVLLFVIFMFRAKNDIVQYQISKDEEIYYYIDDILMEYTGKVTLDRNNKITNLSTNSGDWGTITEPIYYKNSDKVIFPNSMALVKPRDGIKQNKLNYYTIVKKEKVRSRLSNINLDMEVSDAFIYDGLNTYFFLDDVELVYGNEKIELPAFSYVRCAYKDYLFVYNYDTKEMTAKRDITDVVTVNAEGYSINLSTDSLLIDEESIILARNIDKLPAVK